MERDGQVGKDHDDKDLEDQGDENQDVSGVFGGFARIGIGGQGNSRTVKTLDDGHQAAKERRDSARGQGRGIGNVVEHTAEDVVVGQLQEWAAPRAKEVISMGSGVLSWGSKVYSRADQDADLAQNENYQRGTIIRDVHVVVGPKFSHRISNGEQNCGQRV